MSTQTPKSVSAKSLIRKLRKPLAPPTRVIEDEKKYQRAREQERMRRDGESPKAKA
jgi:hypothetical protein